jgi:radical SAM protein (TIGR01212 family)
MFEHSINRELRFNSYGHYLRNRFGCRVSKVNVDGGFTCPNRDGSRGTGGCLYCNNASFSPGGTQPQIPLEEQLQSGISYHRRRLGSNTFIAYFQKHTNTYAPVDRLRELYGRALALPDVIGISIGTRPDAISDEAIELLTDLARQHYVCVELGLQSLNDQTLAWINRGHTFTDYLLAVERLAGRGIELCTHLIHGFPGDTREGIMEAARLIGSLPISSVKMHQLHAVSGTPLADAYHRGEFTPLPHGEYVAAVADFLEHLPPQVAIQRLYGSAPLAIRVAPSWNLKNNQMWYSVVHELKRRGSWQGCRLESGCLSAVNL